MHTVETIERDSGENGWTVAYKTIGAVQDMANLMDSVSMEQVEAVMLAMVDLGYAVMGKPNMEITNSNDKAQLRSEAT